MKLSRIIYNKTTQIIDYLKLIYASNISKRLFKTVGEMVKFNRILDEEARSEYKSVIEQMFAYVPQMMQRKIPEANVQQAFVLDTVYRFASHLTSPKILCVGSHEDTAAASLKMIGYSIVEIDPSINYDLDTYYNLPSTRKVSFDIIFSTSVIEHVENDELFITQIASLLAPGGVAILTADYNDQYKPGDPIPQEDFRLYTQEDFKERLLPLLKDCELVNAPQWECRNPDFTYSGCHYTFATLVFIKNKP